MSIIAQHNMMAELKLTAEPPLGTTVEWRVGAAGLGHDIGHPPFGHVGEMVLQDKLVCEPHRTVVRGSRYGPVIEAGNRDSDPLPCSNCLAEDGFEGNAQSFRILTKLTVRAGKAPTEKTEYRQGLDLTRGSLRAVSKYPWLRGDNRGKLNKWGAYDCDGEELAWVLGGAPDDVLGRSSGTVADQALEARVMDWADDITYAVHDIDDFFRLGLIPLDVLQAPGPERTDFLNYATSAVAQPESGKYDQSDLVALVESVFANFPQRPFRQHPLDIAIVNGLVSSLVNQFVSRSSIEDGHVRIDEKYLYLNQVLKQLTWYYVIDNPSLATIQDGQRLVLASLFDHIHASATEYYLGIRTDLEGLKRRRRLPALLRYYVDFALNEDSPRHGYKTTTQRVARGVADFLASLTDSGAYALHARLVGDRSTSIMQPEVTV